MTRAIQDEHGNWIAVDDEGKPIQAPQGHVGAARREDPETSKEAAEKVDASKLMGRIYDVMKPFGRQGCISDQVDDLLPDVVPQSITPRYRTMVELGMLEVTGEKRIGHKCKRKQMVRRCIPRDRWHERANKVKTVQALDPRILEARDVTKQMSTAMQLMCSEDRVRIAYFVRRLQGILQ